uniref:Uncharacterized protein n=1 Tax=Triticum urartu TaxID=4572 RepID=A0A8R7QPM1_TRIUA
MEHSTPHAQLVALLGFMTPRWRRPRATGLPASRCARGVARRGVAGVTRVPTRVASPATDGSAAPSRGGEKTAGSQSS